MSLKHLDAGQTCEGLWTFGACFPFFLRALVMDEWLLREMSFSVLRAPQEGTANWIKANLLLSDPHKRSRFSTLRPLVNSIAIDFLQWNKQKGRDHFSCVCAGIKMRHEVWQRLQCKKMSLTWPTIFRLLPYSLKIHQNPSRPSQSTRISQHPQIPFPSISLLHSLTSICHAWYQALPLSCSGTRRESEKGRWAWLQH